MKITLIGDSIRQQYAPRVRELLGDGYEVFWPEENCRFAKYVLRGVFDWSRFMAGSDVVHFNVGLWDMCDLFGDGSFSTEEEYVSNVMRIIDNLEGKYKKIIFATTTPVLPTNKFYRQGVTERFNSIIVPRLLERGVIINDLYTPLGADKERYLSEDGVHLSGEGIELAASMVAESVRALEDGSSTEGADSPSQATDTTGAPVLI